MRKLAQEKIAPLVKKMDEEEQLDPSILPMYFENGVRFYIWSSIERRNLIFVASQLMGIEIPAEYGGTGASFFSSILVVEELSKVDPAVSLVCDIQNTLVNSLIMQLGTEEQKNKYLPRLAQDTVNNNGYIFKDTSRQSNTTTFKFNFILY